VKCFDLMAWTFSLYLKGTAYHPSMDVLWLALPPRERMKMRMTTAPHPPGGRYL
jgi:hypothetical protein